MTDAIAACGPRCKASIYGRLVRVAVSAGPSGVGGRVPIGTRVGDTLVDLAVEIVVQTVADLSRCRGSGVGTVKHGSCPSDVDGIPHPLYDLLVVHEEDSRFGCSVVVELLKDEAPVGIFQDPSGVKVDAEGRSIAVVVVVKVALEQRQQKVGVSHGIHGGVGTARGVEQVCHGNFPKSWKSSDRTESRAARLLERFSGQ